MEDDDQSFPHLPPNFVTIHDLQERWLKRQQEKLKLDMQPNDQTKRPEGSQRSQFDLKRENAKESFRNEPYRRLDQPGRWLPRPDRSVRGSCHRWLPAVESGLSELTKSESVVVAAISVDDESSKRAAIGDEAKKKENRDKKKGKNEACRKQKDVESEGALVHAPTEKVKEREFRVDSSESQKVMLENKEVRVEVENGTNKKVNCVRAKGEGSREGLGVVEGILRHLSLKNDRTRGGFRSKPRSNHDGSRNLRRYDGGRKDGGESKNEACREPKDVKLEGVVVQAAVEEVKEWEFHVASSESENVTLENKKVRVEVENGTNEEVYCERAKGDGQREGIGVVDSGVEIEGKLPHSSLKNDCRRGNFQSTPGSNHGGSRNRRRYDGGRKGGRKSKDEACREQKDVKLEGVVVHVPVEEVKEQDFHAASSESENVMLENKKVRVEVENAANKKVNYVSAKGECSRDLLGVVDSRVEIEGKLHHLPLKNDYRRGVFQSKPRSNHGGSGNSRRSGDWREVRKRGSGEQVWIKKGEVFEGSGGITLSSSSSMKSLA